MREPTELNILTLEQDDEPRRLVSIKLTAKSLGDITTREVYKRIDAGDLESVKLGRRRMVTATSIDAYVERLRREADEQRSAAS